MPKQIKPFAELAKLSKTSELSHDALKFKKWLDHHLLKTPEQSKIGKAIRYCLNHWVELSNYLKDGRIEIDNNLIENAIRYFCAMLHRIRLCRTDEDYRKVPPQLIEL